MRWVLWSGGGLVAVLVLYLLVTIGLARRELETVRQQLGELEWTSLSYESSVDGTGPLHALALWPRDGRPLKLLVMMHGYTETAADYFSAGCHWARQGRLVLLPDMRGRHSELRYPMELLARRRPLPLPGWRTVLSLVARPLAEGDYRSGGKPDSGGVEVLDIRDAVALARRQFGDRLARGVDIVGYSGGGTSALLAAIRFPDIFDRVIAFFPIVDFASQEAHLRRLGRAPHAQLLSWLGGGPRQAAGRYAARRLLDGLGNLRWTGTLVLGDSEDESCPVEALERLARRAGELPSIRVLVSRPADSPRWHHDTADEDAALHEAAWPRPVEGERAWGGDWMVLGYLVMPQVEVWLGDGQQGLARCKVSRTDDNLTVCLEPVDLPAGTRARVRVRIAGRWQEWGDLPIDGTCTPFGPSHEEQR